MCIRSCATLHRASKLRWNEGCWSVDLTRGRVCGLSGWAQCSHGPYGLRGRWKGGVRGKDPARKAVSRTWCVAAWNADGWAVSHGMWAASRWWGEKETFFPRAPHPKTNKRTPQPRWRLDSGPVSPWWPSELQNQDNTEFALFKSSHWG